MTNEQLEKLRNQLKREQEEIEHRLSHNHSYGLDLSMKDSVGDLSNHDNHPADVGSEMFEREKDLTLGREDEHRLQEVKNAFLRIDKGTYGICQKCGKEISYERLKAIPYTKYCIEDTD